jgi:WD40 repeat protein
MRWSKNGSRLVSGSQEGQVKLWDIPGQRWLKDLSGSTSVALSVAFSDDGTRIAASFAEGDVAVWDAETSVNIATFRTEYLATCVSFFQDSDHIAFA